MNVGPWSEAAGALDAPLVISTVPAGSADHLARAIPAEHARAVGRPAPGVLLDVVYAPWPTPLATAWEQRGGAVVGGLELLVAQAALQVTAMTGRAAPLAAMHVAGRRALEARAKA
jgi:shikimate dehydrogenase